MHKFNYPSETQDPPSAVLLQSQLNEAMANIFCDPQLDPDFELPPPRYYRKSSSLKLKDCKAVDWPGWSWVARRLLTVSDMNDASWLRLQNALSLLSDEVQHAISVRPEAVVAAYKAHVAVPTDTAGVTHGFHFYLSVGLKLRTENPKPANT